MPVPVDFIKELPKCEHHMHLEGSLEPDLLFPLARRNNITLPDTFPKTIPQLNAKYKQFKDLQDFLDYYYIGTNVLINEIDFFELAMAYFKKINKQNVIHAELFFDPQSHTSRGIPLETVIKGFKKACTKAERDFKITSSLTMCLLRHTHPDECLQLIKDSKKYLTDGTINGLGLDSAEKPFPPDMFVECFSLAKSYNKHLNLTAHAGEEGPASYVSDSLDLLQVTRIDHGINSVQDTELLERLAKEKVLLTVCPLSNVKLNVIKKVDELPLDILLSYGNPFSLNSDDPAYFGGYIEDNYLAVHKAFPNWGYFTWGQIVKNGINTSWISKTKKEELCDKVEAIVAKWVNKISDAYAASHA
ncbi:hypothetical protein TBLA_0D00240 [Henningerozyma blattae CBS 6284]|uniref:Adenine deaminase n=1 Tax=Henningerozyma blattae (strain ATCC 34711 / CBS 6284 / DSM 70876 / NBRC 10599 / NRRL Y-10934 / UCD 77-7) TaxID=1071380 RepID=I2H2D2_HENB6|nr:hypothetical protein TBLA_0D00240 [Tetrapisispora blattae CBS 6284]CCH60534.1 hypothetical protein TBLA_0D00240 [Tetrapisispora blattae CBS 6284]